MDSEEVKTTTRVVLIDNYLYLQYVDDNFGGYYMLPYDDCVHDDEDLLKVLVRKEMKLINEKGESTNHLVYTYVKITDECVTDLFKTFVDINSFKKNTMWMQNNRIEGKVLSTTTCRIIKYMIRDGLI